MQKQKKKKIKTNSTTVFEVEQKLNVMMTSFNKCRIVKFKIQELLKNWFRIGNCPKTKA